MCKLFIYKQCINISYLIFIYNEKNENENEEKIMGLLKYTCLMLIDEHTIDKSVFQIKSLKLAFHKRCNRFIYMYPKYSNYLEDFNTIFTSKNNDTFIHDFKSKIFSCDDLFVLYLMMKYYLNDYVDFSSFLNKNVDLSI
jgi:hypothetical protein